MQKDKKGAVLPATVTLCTYDKNGKMSKGLVEVTIEALGRKPVYHGNLYGGTQINLGTQYDTYVIILREVTWPEYSFAGTHGAPKVNENARKANNANLFLCDKYQLIATKNCAFFDRVTWDKNNPWIWTGMDPFSTYNSYTTNVQKGCMKCGCSRSYSTMTSADNGGCQACGHARGIHL